MSAVLHMAGRANATPVVRVRPADAGWPSEQDWQTLRQSVGDALLPVRFVLQPCLDAPRGADCADVLRSIANPYFLGDEPGLAQSLGWVDAWTFQPSPWAVAARHAADVSAGVAFARKHRLRLVVKGGGHSYQGTSSAPDSLLVWTRRMNRIELHEQFVAQGCNAKPVRAVAVGAGAVWAHVYDAVTTQAGGYVQGGGCMTVGVAGLVQSGGFGSFSKAWGLAAASLLEAEVVTADGQVRIANAGTHPDLFWGLKGGGGGSLGIVTRLTLKVHELPERFGAVNIDVQATSDAAFRRLIAHMLDFYRSQLWNPHWGEQMRFRSGNRLQVAMVFQGMDRGQAMDVWQPFFDTLARSPDDFQVAFSPLRIVSTSARTFFAPTWPKRLLGLIGQDDRPGAAQHNVFWPGDAHQAGQVFHGYASTWLPASLLDDGARASLVDALFDATRHASVALHVNKGLAGASASAIAAARETATHPAALDAFALAISAAGQGPAYPGWHGHEPDVGTARSNAQAVRQATAALRRVVPEVASYVAESDYFEADWQRAFWGANYPRLLAVKRRYDPEGLFYVHHGVGSEDWREGGFVRAG